jgi:hypothetical protein
VKSLQSRLNESSFEEQTYWILRFVSNLTLNVLMTVSWMLTIGIIPVISFTVARFTLVVCPALVALSCCGIPITNQEHVKMQLWWRSSFWCLLMIPSQLSPHNPSSRVLGNSSWLRLFPPIKQRKARGTNGVIRGFPAAPCQVLAVRFKCSQHPVRKHLQSIVSRNVRDQVLLVYKTIN